MPGNHTRYFDRCRMNKTRLEAFSDGVIAIIITIMVLEIKCLTGQQLMPHYACSPFF